ncbi:hypothetical protein [Kitasatospora aureofaciens]|uniref:hypothetical protein n=1 Tax=Kitasatospora aureofaciens TaxID=1894 RepID=UPI0036F450CC
MTTEAELLTSDDQRLEELFRKSSAGEIPRGPMEGLAVFPAAGRAGARLLASLVNLTAWRGKVFSPDGYLSNRLTAMDILSVVATVGPGPSRLGPATSGLPTTGPKSPHPPAVTAWSNSSESPHLSAHP